MKPLLPSLARTTDPHAAYAKRYIIAITVTLATVLLTLDLTIVSVAVPSMMGNLGATLDEIAWVTTGYALANVIVMPISGWLGDWFGRRNYFAMSILVFTLSSLMCGWSSSLEELVFWRIVQGLAGGGLVSTAQVTLIEVFPSLELGKGMAIWGIGLMLGPTIGPPLGGWLTETLSWPWIFYVNLPVGALTLLLALLYVPDSRFARKPDKVDFFGLMLLIVAVGTLQALLERGDRQDWLASREIFAYCIVCPVAMALLVWHELRCPHPVIEVRVFANRQFAASMLLMGAVGFANNTYIFGFPVMMQSLHGYSAAQAGWAIMPLMITSVFSFVFLGKLISRPGVDLRLLVLTCIAFSVIAFWLHSYASSAAAANDFLLPQVLLGLGLPMGLMALTSLGTATLRNDQVAGANALINFSRNMGASLGVALFATLIPHFFQTSRAALILHINSFSNATTDRVALLRDFLTNHGTPLATAQRKAMMLLNMEVGREAEVIAFNQAMGTIALIILLTFLAIPLLETGHWHSKSEPAH